MRRGAERNTASAGFLRARENRLRCGVMNLNEIIQYSTIGTAAVAVFSVIFAVVSHRRQINASIYLDLSERMHRLLQGIPMELRSAHLAGEARDTLRTAHGMILAADFLHLMSSAHALYTCGYFSGRLWKQLRLQAEHGLRTPIFREHWPQLRKEFIANPAFVTFVEAQFGNAGGRKCDS